MLQWISEAFWSVVAPVAESFMANTENKKRCEAKRLMLEEPALAETLKVVAEKLRRLQSAAPGYDPTMKLYRENRRAIAELEKAFAKANRAYKLAHLRLETLYRSLRGKLDAEPEAMRRSFSEWAGDTMAHVIPTLAANRADDLEALVDGITARITEVLAARESFQLAAQQASTKRLGDMVIGTMSPVFQKASAEYFRTDRELIRLRAELAKTEERWTTFLAKRLTA
jgi:DNA repair exonuclease SbcCD ATPase subunit